MASLNFVDLAGIEEISEISSSGLKKSNRNFISLRALASVIKKLSDGENHDIPYKDLKLTEILKSSLVGNARTSIICTISPSSSHLDQTRYTLSFGSKGKAVLNTLWVNVHEIEFDWRDRIKFLPVGDQYPGGSCFAFAVCAAAEAKHQIRTKQIVSLSQQDIYTALVKKEQQDRKGQNLENVFEYVTNEGFIRESDFPYVGQFKASVPNPRNVFLRLGNDYLELSSIETIKEELRRWPLVGGFTCVPSMCTDFTGDGILYPPSNEELLLESNGATYHFVLVIGIGSKQEENGDVTTYYVIRNSYGERWGNKGYGRVDRKLFSEIWSLRGATSLCSDQ